MRRVSPVVLLKRVTRLLGPDRHDWGRAMLAELDHVVGTRNRWRFALGCTAATLLAPTRRVRTRTAAHAVLGSCILGCGGLTAFGALHYPVLRRTGGALGYLATLTLVLFGYACCGLLLSRESRIDLGLARRRGLTGGLIVGSTWISVVIVPGLEVARPVLFAVLIVVPFAVGNAVTRSTHSGAAAIRSGLWGGLTGGLLVFMVLLTLTYVAAGGPYDPGTVHDFAMSGSRDLQTFAMADDFGGALVMLLLVPTIGVAFAALGGIVASRGGHGQPARAK